MTSACCISNDLGCRQLWALQHRLQQMLRAGCTAQGIQELQAHITALQSEPSPLEAARAELAACEGDRAKFLRLLEQLQARPPSSSMQADALHGAQQMCGTMQAWIAPTPSLHFNARCDVLPHQGRFDGRAACQSGGMGCMSRMETDCGACAGKSGGPAEEGGGEAGRHARSAAGAGHRSPGDHLLCLTDPWFLDKYLHCVKRVMGHACTQASL